MGSPLIGRTEEILSLMLRFLPEETRYLFVSEYRDGEGNRSYESLWVLTDNIMAEAHQFVTERSFDFTPTSHGLRRMLVENEEFDFEEAQESSRLKVDVNVSNSGAGLVGVLRASGSNCTDLQQIVSEYLVPLLLTAVEGEPLGDQ